MFVAYSAGLTAGARAVEQLALVAIEAELVPLRNSVLIGQVGTAFDGRGEPIGPAADTAMSIALQDLSWWAHLLRGPRRGHAPTGLPAREIGVTRRTPPGLPSRHVGGKT